jgi:hypothetical protein
MGNEGSVDGDEPQALDLTLRQQHPIEWVASRRLGIDGSNRVAFIDRNDRYAQTLDKLGQGGEARR